MRSEFLKIKISYLVYGLSLNYLIWSSSELLSVVQNRDLILVLISQVSHYCC